MPSSFALTIAGSDSDAGIPADLKTFGTFAIRPADRLCIGIAYGHLHHFREVWT